MRFTDSVLDDGTYDVFVVDAASDDDTAGVHLELTITSGEHKGEVIALRAAQLGRDPVMLIGLPAELRVSDGVPSVNFD